ncbi:hypothetical protein DPMN_166309 [Dreissena polymorpha]|uniref:Uncharacterized protein n=1 Tax=Dreissena polymorpha TaxID=45954 RepID=A0A9D4EYL5_DREPO|nr:hypothetical protein DPMN_166309 [Dreissena polymorpha]
MAVDARCENTKRKSKVTMRQHEITMRKRDLETANPSRKKALANSVDPDETPRDAATKAMNPKGPCPRRISVITKLVLKITAVEGPLR